MNFESLRNKFEKLRAEWAEDSHVDFQFIKSITKGFKVHSNF